MADLARGTVTDRPWGRTLAALGLRGVSGQLTVVANAKPYCIVFARGAVVAASSPLASDAAVRVAMTGHLISSTQVADISRKQAAAPQRDEIEVMAEAARFSSEQALRLRRRVIAQRAARTFALTSGDFVVRDEIELPLVENCDLDIRSVIYLGAKSMLSEARLGADLAEFGTWFQLKTEAADDLPYFGFGPSEQAALALIARGAGLEELESQPDIDAQIARAVVYALVSCNAVVVDGPLVARPTVGVPAPQRRTPSGPPVTQPRSATAPPSRSTPPTTSPPLSRTGTGSMMRTTPPTVSPPLSPPVASPGRSTTPTGSPPLDAPTPSGRPLSSTAGPLERSNHSTTAPFRRPPADAATLARPARTAAQGKAPAPQAIGRPADAAQTAEVELLIETRLALVERKYKGDHYQLLAIPRDATPRQIRDMYFQLARQLHPDRLSALGIVDANKRAQRLMAEVNTAFAVLDNPEKRAAYTSILARGGEAVVRAEEQQAEDMTLRILDAEEAFRRGEMAIKRDSLQTGIRELEIAIQLNPDEPDYHATLAWAKFAAAPDKMSVAAATRAALGEAIKMSARSLAGKFYLGRVERMLGKDQEALQLFKDVIEMEPSHHEASSEIRVLEARLGRSDKGGLFGRSKR